MAFKLLAIRLEYAALEKLCSNPCWLSVAERKKLISCSYRLNGTGR